MPEPPGATCGEGAFTAEFFDNTDLAGRAVLVECHEDIDFDWGRGRAHPRVPEDHFGVRWSAAIDLSGGTYRFTASTDDGTRVSLDGEVIIDAWRPRSVGATVAYGFVPEGRHVLVVEYFEQAGFAVARLEWERSRTGWWQALPEPPPWTSATV